VEGSSAGEQPKAGKGATFVGIFALVLLAAAIVFVGIEAFPHHIKAAKNPNFVDNIATNSVVIFAVRLALFFGLVYVGVSVVGLIVNRQWLSQLGPVKASEPIAKLEKSAEKLENELKDALQTIKDLRGRVSESDRALEEASATAQELLDHIDKMEGEKEGI
jgi:peptidoglycan hydrolase CwlO-like protein